MINNLKVLMIMIQMVIVEHDGSADGVHVDDPGDGVEEKEQL